MKFSLILATINRVDELYRFFDSLLEQSYKEFEVILVDQNKDSRLSVVVEHYITFLDIKHIKIEPKGLSNARNVGLEHIQGDVIAFPDDDCWYPKDLLLNVERLFHETSQYWGFTGRCQNEQGEESVGKFPMEEMLVEKDNVFKVAVSITIFVRYCEEFKFNEQLGVGSNTVYKSGEETDYVLQMLSKGYKLLYTPDIILGHPSEFVKGGAMELYKKAKQYGVGFGYLLKCYKFNYATIIKYLVRPIGGCFLSLILLRIDKVMYYIGSFLGRIKGFFYESKA